jgi:hypothetical protein
MDYAFKDIVGEIIMIYQYDLTIFSKERNARVHCLKQVFKTCQRYRISLNPKKLVFGVDEGKLLGHIMFKEGVKIDTKKNRRNLGYISLQQIDGAIFLWPNQFIGRFIPNFVEITMPISKMLKKDP